MTTSRDVEGTTQPTAAAPATASPDREPWPEGPPSTYVKTRFPPAAGVEPDRQLMVELTRLSTELSRVPPSEKDLSLTDAGLSAEWVAAASPAQKEQALARIRDAP